MDRIYSLAIVGRRGMYCHGAPAATPELARQCQGLLIRRPKDRLAIVESRRLPGYWTDSGGNQHERWSGPVTVEIESTPGEWTISGSTL